MKVLGASIIGSFALAGAFAAVPAAAQSVYYEGAYGSQRTADIYLYESPSDTVNIRRAPRGAWDNSYQMRGNYEATQPRRGYGF